MLIVYKISIEIIYIIYIRFFISSDCEGLTVALTRRIRNKPVTGNWRFRWCNYDGGDPDICEILTGLWPTSAVGPKEDF